MKTVLYAEDYPDDIFFMERAFKRLAPESRLVVVNNGSEAIAYLSENRPLDDHQVCLTPSLVLLDLSMPIMNGFEVLKWIRSQPEKQNLPVFVLTSSDNDEDRRRAASLGASGYLVKPGQPDGLVDVLIACRDYWQ